MSQLPDHPAYRSNIKQRTIRNCRFRRIEYTGTHLQVVLMSIPPRGQIGIEIHPETDQFIRVEQGRGVAHIGGRTFRLSDGVAIVIPQGVEHNIINTGSEDLKLYTIYGPPEHDH